MPFPEFRVKLSGGCVYYLESKLEFQIPLVGRIRVEERINDQVSVLLRLSFCNRTIDKLIFEYKFGCQ